MNKYQSLDPAWAMISYAMLIMAIFPIIMYSQDYDYQWWVHGLWCIIGASICLFQVLKLILIDPKSFLCDHRVVATFSFAFYFFRGASFLTFGDEDAISLAMQAYPVTVKEAFKVDAINALGMAVLLFSFNILNGNRKLQQMLKTISIKFSNFKRNNVYIFLIVAASIGYISNVKYFLADTDVTNNAIFPTLDKFNLILIYLFQNSEGKNKKFLRLISFIIMIMQVFSGLIVLSKSAIFLPIVIYLFSLIVRKKMKITSIFIIGIIFFSVMQLSSSIITTTRAAIGENIRTLSFSDRMYSIYSYANYTDIDRVGYSFWSRISYVVMDASAVRFYDDGQGGDETRLIPWLFVPRILFPNKPVISDLGTEYFIKLTGNEGSSIGFGVFTDGYYNFGWIGVIIFGAIYGLILRQTSLVSSNIINNNIQLIYPLALFGVIMGYRIDGKFIVDQLGMFVILIYAIILMYLYSKCLPNKSTSQ